MSVRPRLRFEHGLWFCFIPARLLPKGAKYRIGFGETMAEAYQDWRRE